MIVQYEVYIDFINSKFGRRLTHEETVITAIRKECDAEFGNDIWYEVVTVDEHAHVKKFFKFLNGYGKDKWCYRGCL